VLFYNPSLFSSIRSKQFNCGRAACPFTAASSAACWRWCCSRGGRGISILSLGDLTCATGTIGLFLGRIANFINGELWGRPADVPWAMVFPGGGRCRAIQASSTRPRSKVWRYASCLADDARRRVEGPGLVIGAFAAGYSIARSSASSFREPDPQLGFLWGGMTMGMLLSVPLMLTGFAFIAAALKRPPREPERHGVHAARSEVRRRNPDGRADAGAPIHGAVPQPSGARLLHHARPARARWRLHHRPEISQCSANCSAYGRRQRGTGWDSRKRAAGRDWPRPRTMMLDALRAAQCCRRSALPSCCIWSRSARRCRKRQQQAMATLDVPVMWHETFDEVPDGPVIVLANELFDALPVNQAIKQFNGWYERVVEIRSRLEIWHFGMADEVIRCSSSSCASMRDVPIGQSTNGAPTICRSRSAGA